MFFEWDVLFWLQKIGLGTFFAKRIFVWWIGNCTIKTQILIFKEFQQAHTSGGSGIKGVRSTPQEIWALTVGKADRVHNVHCDLQGGEEP